MSKHLSILLALALPFAACAQGFGDSVRLTQVASGLTQPLAVRHAGDGSGRLFIVQQNGVIRWMDANGALQATPFLNVATDVSNCALADNTSVSLGFSTGGERGLLGLAFHPDFENNGFFYVNYTDAAVAGTDGRGDTVIARFHAPGSGNVADPNSCTVLMRIDQDFQNHNGGDLHFGPDGFLYIALGDGGSGNDPCNRAQTLNPALLQGEPSGGTGDSATNGNCHADDGFLSPGAGDPDSRALLGKMLRIDVNGTTAAIDAAGLCGAMVNGPANYRIPNDPVRPNPFSDAGDPACDEVWAYGLRNPWRFSFDRTTGDLLIGDVGQGTTEEVDVEPAADAGGRNYGWDVCEGPWLTGSRSNLCTLPGATAPILEFSSQDLPSTNPTNRCSLTGGFRYRGDNAFFNGTYVYGDYCSGELLMARETSPGVWNAEVWATPNVPFSFGVVGFGEDENGALYLAKAGGTVYRFDIHMLFRDGFED